MLFFCIERLNQGGWKRDATSSDRKFKLFSLAKEVAIRNFKWLKITWINEIGVFTYVIAADVFDVRKPITQAYKNSESLVLRIYTGRLIYL